MVLKSSLCLLNVYVSDKCIEHTIVKPQGSRKENVLFFAKESLLQEANGLGKFMSLPPFISGSFKKVYIQFIIAKI